MKATEVLLWSIALPGFGQILNKKILKGIIFIVLEIIVNVQSNLNTVLLYSFYGEIDKAIEHADYQWLLFYPCLYFFAMWDAYRDAGGGRKPYSFLPFVFAAYFVTVGTIYSPQFTIFEVLLGPIWLPILSVLPGFLIGILLQWIIRKRQ
ncbi:hypothetical protein JCM21714_1399 [Gracilibacillus boraciitolerans JCM 21714]|uniref:Uncharacterized protein n=1 Tax=Gracilibacillus boraciitolerans JCM 21714 TaxID=1298598 RepID=W4VI26_9BACI|nr:hypothetical protein [Gracilibacillus boraciitolerans]GAE92404.1 hypothetical protein JCM21714_1399 [Gracilibacillus boraciitolerans JCM 21714]